MAVYDAKWEKRSVEDKLAHAKSELEKDIARWNEIKANGCNDPNWPDGVNLNLKRNHIIYDLRVIYELEQKPRQVSFLEELGGCDISPIGLMDDSRIPPLVDSRFMANDRKLANSF